MSRKKFEIQRAALYAQAIAFIDSGKNPQLLYFISGRCILEGENHRDLPKDMLYRLFWDLRNSLREARGIGMPTARQMRNVAAAYSGFDHNIVNKALVAYTWLTHIMLINTVKATAARLFYLQRAVGNEWKYQQLEQAISTGLYEREGNGPDSYIIKLDL